MKYVVNKATLKRIGTEVISYIKSNTRQGIDRFGKQFVPYSRRPFSMPLGAFYEQTTKQQRTRLNKDGDLQIYRSKRSGARWVTIDGGYAMFKAMRFPNQNGVVNLSVRGNRGGMMGALQIIEERTNSVVIGFSSEEAAKLAYYHTVSGAGRSRVIRDFFGVTAEQLRELEEIAIKGVEVELSVLGKPFRFKAE